MLWRPGEIRPGQELTCRIPEKKRIENGGTERGLCSMMCDVLAYAEDVRRFAHPETGRIWIKRVVRMAIGEVGGQHFVCRA